MRAVTDRDMENLADIAWLIKGYLMARPEETHLTKEHIDTLVTIRENWAMKALGEGLVSHDFSLITGRRLCHRKGWQHDCGDARGDQESPHRQSARHSIRQDHG